jgi:Rhodopirellula transposase DDE domain
VEQDRAPLFSFISQDWRAKPLVSYKVIVELIAATTTGTGLTARCELDNNRYPKGITVSDAEMATINITRADFHGDWNYTHLTHIKSCVYSLTSPKSFATVTW